MKQALFAILTVLSVIISTSASFAATDCMPNALSYARENLNEKFELGQLTAYSWQHSGQTTINLKGYSVKSSVKVSDHFKDSYSVVFELEDPYRKLPEISLKAELYGLNVMTNDCRNDDLLITYKATFTNN
jgi:hypothetical protein